MFSCMICYEDNKISGISCPLCKNKCCISCELQLDNCPFCRSKLILMGKRISLMNDEQTNTYLEHYLQNRQKEMEKYLKLKTTFENFWYNKDILLLDEIIEYSQDDTLQLLIVMRDFLYENISKCGEYNECKKLLMMMINIMEETQVFIEIDYHCIFYNFCVEEFIIIIYSSFVYKYNNVVKWTEGAKDYTRLLKL